MCTESVTSQQPPLGRELGKALCQALGIDAKGIRRISVEASVNGRAIVTVDRLPELATVQSLAYRLRPLTERYELHRMTGDSQ